MPYALLQRSLDQTIDRESLEEAAAASHSIPRPDCARLQKELFGIVVDNLDQEHALALQGELNRHNFPTDVIDQTQLAALNEAASGQEFQVKPHALIVADVYGTQVEYPWEKFVFAAAGYVLRIADRPIGKHLEPAVDAFRSTHSAVKVVVDYKLQNVPQFRFDWFFDAEPYRWQWIWDRESIVRVNQEPIRLSQHEKFVLLLQQLTSFLPTERLNGGVRKLSSGGYFVYPSVRAFEEEIVWSFYQLMHSVSG
jgi:hypothetical protein